MSKLTVEQWRRMVFASRDPQMSPAVQVLCLYLADRMTPNRKVSVPRKDIAVALGCHEQRIAERFAKAVLAGFLFRVQAGHVGRTAVYQACRPDEVRTANPYTPKGPQSGTHSVRNHGAKDTALQGAIEETEPLAGPTYPDDGLDPGGRDFTTLAPTWEPARRSA